MTTHDTSTEAPSEEQIRQMTPEEAMIAGAAVDGVYIVHHRDRFPIRGTKAEKRAIVAYVQTIKASKDPGGNGIDRIGPVSEAIVIWVGGVGALMIAILWIGARVR
jgi:hypothetical protein